MLTAWIVASALMAVVGMIGELRKGSSVPVIVAGGICSFVLWPVAVFFWIMLAVIALWYVAGMKFF